MYIRSFLSVEAAGRIGADAVVKETRTGRTMVAFSVAVEERTAEKKGVRWFDVTYFGGDPRLAEVLRRGTLVHVRGDLTVKEGEKRVFVGITAREINVLAFAPREGVSAGRSAQGGYDSRRRSYEQAEESAPPYYDVPPDDYESCRESSSVLDAVYDR